MTNIDLPSAPAAASLTRSALVAREFVHRLAPSQVLLTDVRPQGPDEFRAVAQWPRPDPLLVAETLRQLGVYLPLRYYGVDAASRLLVEELSFELDPAAEPRDHHVGAEITCSVQVERPRAAAEGQPHSLGIKLALAAKGATFAQAAGVTRVLSLAAYRAVRNRRRLARAELGGVGALTPATPESVGATLVQDVLVALDRDGVARLSPADPGHAFFHDHPHDQITGVTLIGAVRQAAALHSGQPGRRLVSCSLRALRFTEPDPPAAVEVDEAGRFEIRQDGTVTATGEVRLAD